MLHGQRCHVCTARRSAAARLTDAEGKLYASTTSTLLVFDREAVR